MHTSFPSIIISYFELLHKKEVFPTCVQKKEQPIKIDCASYQAFSAICCAIFSLATAIINLMRFS